MYIGIGDREGKIIYYMDGYFYLMKDVVSSFILSFTSFGKFEDEYQK